jgi:FHA domain
VTVTRSVVPGEWYGVLGDSVIALLPPAAKSRVAALWERVDEGAGFDEVLDALIRDGLRDLPGFVLVSTEDADAKVVIRGAGTAELTTDAGPVSISGSADTTWVERNVSGVTGLRLHVGDADPLTGGDDTAYTMGTGLVRVARIEQPATSGATTPPPPGAAPERAPAPPAPPGPKAPEPPPTPALPPVPVPAPVPPPLGGPMMEPVLTPDPPVLAEPAPAEDLEDTQSGGFVAAPAEEPETAPTSRPVARLIFSTGEVVDVDRPVVIGRAPGTSPYGDDRARVVTVPSPHQEISSTHVEIRPGTGADHGSVVATDLGSTNGTVVVQPGLPAEDLRPGIAVALVPGAVVDLGEGVTIQVTSV